MLADGSVHIPLDVKGARVAVARARDAGAEALAVVFLHSYASPVHEAAVRELAREIAPGLPVILSSDVSPQYREYERTNTTVVNAYITPRFSQYLGALTARLAERGFKRRLYVMQNNGGIATADTAAAFPVRSLDSGPAAGAILAAHIGRLTGHEDLIAFDMGGTTAKACLIEKGVPASTDQLEVDMIGMRKGSGLPVQVPQRGSRGDRGGRGEPGPYRARHPARGAGKRGRRPRARLLRPGGKRAHGDRRQSRPRLPRRRLLPGRSAPPRRGRGHRGHRGARGEAARRERGRCRVGHPSARDAQHGGSHPRGVDREGQGSAIARLRHLRRRRSDSRSAAGPKPRAWPRDRSLRGGRRLRHGTAHRRRALRPRAHRSWPGSPPPRGTGSTPSSRPWKPRARPQILATGLGGQWRRRRLAEVRYAGPGTRAERGDPARPSRSGVAHGYRARSCRGLRRELRVRGSAGHAARGDQLEARDQLRGARGGSGGGLVPRGRGARARGRGPCISPSAAASSSAQSTIAIGSVPTR
jgi:hypothetical protein